jgi:CRISPR-associated endoribonuclease Cas2 subtype I-E
MLIVSLTKAPPNLGSVLGVYLFKVNAGLYAGEVTKRVLEYLLEVIPCKIGKGSAILVWKNAKATTGFEVFEITGGGSEKLRKIDGISLNFKGIS